MPEKKHISTVAVEEYIHPEIVSEYVMSYAIEAQQFVKQHTASYQVGIIPYGPHYYTGILQAAGYVLLHYRGQCDTLVLVTHDDAAANEVAMTVNPMGPFLGKKRDVAPIATDIRETFGFITAHASDIIPSSVESQLPFIRILTDISSLIVLHIGENVAQKTTDTIMKHIKKNHKHTGIVFLENLHNDAPHTVTKNKDNQLIKTLAAARKQPLSSKFINTANNLIRASRKRLSCVAYTNSGDMGGENTNTTGYGCFVG